MKKIRRSGRTHSMEKWKLRSNGNYQSAAPPRMMMIIIINDEPRRQEEEKRKKEGRESLGVRSTFARTIDMLEFLCTVFCDVWR